MTGRVTDPDGAAVPVAHIEARPVETGAIFKAESSVSGTYSLSGLPGGTYKITVPPLGFSFAKFERKDVVLREAEQLAIDIRLEWGPNLGTPGDDPSIALRAKYASTSGPAPRTSDGKPDFSGNWLGADDPNPEEPAMLPWAKALAEERRANSFRDAPTGFCMPGDAFPRGPLLFRIVQTPDLLVQLTEDIISHRQVFLDGRSHPQDPNPTFWGHSTGTWDGDVLVIDSIGFNDKTWMPNGEPHTEALHVVERYQRPDKGHLKIDVTIEDPGAFTKPFQFHMVWTLAPGEEVGEYVCENNRDAEHLK